MPLVTVFTAFNPAEAHVVRSCLDAANFHPVVMHELSALSLDGYALAAGGILVQVPEAEAEEAREFLQSPPPVTIWPSPPSTPLTDSSRGEGGGLEGEGHET